LITRLLQDSSRYRPQLSLKGLLHENGELVFRQILARGIGEIALAAVGVGVIATDRHTVVPGLGQAQLPVGIVEGIVARTFELLAADMRDDGIATLAQRDVAIELGVPRAVAVVIAES